MTTIHLHNIRMFSFHGVYEEELSVGNEYEVDLAVSFEETPNQFSSLSGTINYETLFEIVKQRMHISTPLLEKVCESIIGRIRHQYPFVSEIKLSLFKLQAAIQNLEGKVGVTMHKVYHAN